MAQIIWPLTLPQVPQLSDYKESRPSHILRSSTEYGPAKVRARGGNKPIMAEATYYMTDEEVKSLDTFIYDTDGLAGGVRCFDWPRPKWGRKNNAITKPTWQRDRITEGDVGRIYQAPRMTSDGYVRARIVPASEDAMYELTPLDTIGHGTAYGAYTTSQLWSVTLHLELFYNAPTTSNLIPKRG